MAKVFTITEGLENMGALKTGGQGSVYKGRRTGEIITAVKLLPTPIHSENEEDKHYLDFKNEVEKLKKVNEQPNPYVVKILNAGITDTGSFPFIEMEFIEGPDLEELLEPPRPGIFTIKEGITVAEQLSNALSHCHSFGIKHGDIKSNNVKLNTHTGNYVLLDFGLAVMSDEQRRTSLRHAGAIEFMAPEQNEGKMLFQTDVYSFGIILFELLAGRVPYPLNDRTETARNKVMLAHMEEPLPDLLALCSEHLPEEWTEEQKVLEMQVPEWLLQTLERCLQKDPQARFASGIELHDHIALHSTGVMNTASTEVPDSTGQLALLKEENEQLIRERSDLQKQLSTAQQRIRELEGLLLARETELREHAHTAIPASYEAPGRSRRSNMIPFLLLALVLGAVGGYVLLKGEQDPQIASDRVSTGTGEYTTTETTNTSSAYGGNEEAPVETTTPFEERPAETMNTVQEPATDTAAQTPVQQPEEKAEEKQEEAKEEKPKEEKEPEKKEEEKRASEGGSVGKFKVANKAYFHNEPDESTRREAFIIHWNNAVLQPTEERDGFVYVVFTNHLGQTSRGWLRKKDLIPVKD